MNGGPVNIEKLQRARSSALRLAGYGKSEMPIREKNPQIDVGINKQRHIVRQPGFRILVDAFSFVDYFLVPRQRHHMTEIVKIVQDSCEPIVETNYTFADPGCQKFGLTYAKLRRRFANPGVRIFRSKLFPAFFELLLLPFFWLMLTSS